MTDLKLLREHAGYVLRDLLYWFNPIVGDSWQGASLHNYFASFVDYPANRLTASLYPIFRKMRFDKIGIYVTGAGGVGARVRVGLHKDNGAFYPSDLLLDSGELNAESTGIKTKAIDLTSEPGVYWVVVITNDGTIDLACTGDTAFLSFGGEGAPDFSVSQKGSWYITQTYGPLPNPFPAGASLSRILMHVRLGIAEVL